MSSLSFNIMLLVQFNLMEGKTKHLTGVNGGSAISDKG